MYDIDSMVFKAILLWNESSYFWKQHDLSENQTPDIKANCPKLLQMCLKNLYFGEKLDFFDSDEEITSIKRKI